MNGWSLGDRTVRLFAPSHAQIGPSLDAVFFLGPRQFRGAFGSDQRGTRELEQFADLTRI